MGRVQDKTIIVTGAAHGLGKSTAGLLAKEGAKIILTDVDVDAVENTAREIRDLGGRADFFRHDVSRPDDWEQVFSHALSSHGKLDGLVNNAGFGTYNDIETVTLEQWRSIMAVNLDGTFIGTQLAIRSMKTTGGGTIVNIASVAAFVGAPNLAAYSASKAGVHLLTKSAAVYCGQRGYNIRVNSVHPGLVETRAGIEMARLATSAPNDDDAIKFFSSLHPLGRIGRPEEVAYAVLYLASDESSFVTGSALVIDGGYTAI